MSYFSAGLNAVPTANKATYREHAIACWPLFRSYGALRMVEAWGVDVPRGEVTDFYRAVDATDDETIVLSWIEWPDKATADASWGKMEADPAMKTLPEPCFDGSRMIFGGFEPVFEAGHLDAPGYYQGFVLAAPAQNKAKYAEAAAEGWALFEKGGALGMLEGWGVDVPRGKKTDFYRATRAEDGEVAIVSWATWPDRATCDKASATMEADMAEMGGMDMANMPFDASRMFWGGFEPLFDSANA